MTLLGRRKSKTVNRLVDLDKIIIPIGLAAKFWPTQSQAAVLARARLGDACRNAGLRPVDPARFDQSWQSLNDESRLRLCVSISAFDGDFAKNLLHEFGDALVVLDALHALAERLEFLTTELMTQSDVRLEEFARHFCVTVGLSIDDESAEKSAARLHDIDFARLMKEAAAARSSADDRMAYLRKLQEEQEATRRPRRGKW